MHLAAVAFRLGSLGCFVFDLFLSPRFLCFFKGLGGLGRFVGFVCFDFLFFLLIRFLVKLLLIKWLESSFC